MAFDAALLEVIPAEVVERDYGCGDPTRWVQSGDTVLDLGSGSGKNAFICAQVVGAGGRVLGVDRNAEMLALSRAAAPVVAQRIGVANVEFLEGAIEALDVPTTNGQPLVTDASVDLVLSNCVLNLVNPSARERLLANIRRVLRPGGRVAISDIVCDRPVPLALQQDPDLWSGCISGAWQEQAFLADFVALVLRTCTTPIASASPGGCWRASSSAPSRSSALCRAAEQGLEAEPFLSAHGPPGAGRQTVQVQGQPPIHQIDAAADQAQGGQPDSSCHATHLTVAPFLQAQFEPSGGDGAPFTDRRHPIRPLLNLFAAEMLSPSRQGLAPLHHHAITQLLQLLLRHCALHLHPIGAPVAEAGIGEALLEPPFSGEQQQSLAIRIKAPGGIDPGYGHQISQAAPTAARFRGELAEHAVGLVQQQG